MTRPATLTGKDKAQPDPVALFVSDVHLQSGLPRTTEAFLDFLRRAAVRASALYILGDLFEYWAGDDDLTDPYHQRITTALRTTSEGGTFIGWIPGNRDFLTGQGFAQACGAVMLEEPHVATIAGHKVVLLHGDAQCTDDQGYMAFRSQVRTPAWQQQFLAMPLAQRKAIIENMRAGSRAAQQEKSCEIMDVNADAIRSVFEATDAAVMIHGHTHRPARHVHHLAGRERLREVLPDWDCDTDTPRGGWLAIYADGRMQRFNWDGSFS